MYETEYIERMHLLASVWSDASRFIDPGSMLMLLYQSWRD